MESPGEYLKREREHRGISLEDIFKATRVPLKHLEALEADNYDSMPHPTFTKGYIRSYCKVLGVDETDAVLRYEIYLKDKAGSAETVKAAPRPPRPRKIQQPPLLGQFWGDKRNVIMVAVGASAVVIIILAYLIFGSMSPAPEPLPFEEQAAEEAAGAAPDAAPETAPVKAPVREAAPPAPPKAAEKAPAPVKAVEKPVEMRHSLVVKATEAVWIQVVIDGASPFDVTLKQGETIVWKAAESLSLKIGNAGGVSLSFNGKQMAPVGGSGYVVKLDLPGGKVTVLSGPKPEEEPAEEKLKEKILMPPAGTMPEMMTPVPAGTMPVLEPRAPAAGTKPAIKAPADAAGTKPEIKTPVPAAGTKPEIKTPEPAAGTKPEIKTPVPAAGVKPEVKTPEPAAGTKPEIKTPVPAAGVKPEVKTPVPAAGVKPEVKTPVPAAGVKPEVKTPAEAAAPQAEEAGETDSEADLPPAP